MDNPQYIEYLNASGADINVKPQPCKRVEPLEKRDSVQLKEHIAQGLPPITTGIIDDLPFKIKTDEWGWQEVEGVGKFPTKYKDLIDYD